MALALLAWPLLAPSAISAQEALPTVGDYRFPRGKPTPAARPQGPVDSDAPQVRELPPVAAPAETPEASPSAEAVPQPKSSPSSAASPKPSASATPAAASSKAATAPPVIATTATSAPSAAAPQPAVSEALPSVSAVPSVAATQEPQITWRVHSAKQAGEQALTVWPWLVGLAFLLGSGGTFLFQRFLRVREQRAAWAETANRQFEEAAPPVEPDVAVQVELPVIAATVVADEPVEAPEAAPIFFAQPEPEPDALQPAPLFAEPVQQSSVGPLGVTLVARRLSATLMNTVLNYELVLTNSGSDAIGPIHIGGDMISAHASLPTRSQLELSGNSIEPLHALPALAPGESVALAGDLRLALSAITPIRSGDASLFVPLVRFRVEALRRGAPPLVLNHTSVIGESQHAPDSALKPFRLDLGPRLYSDISQRELSHT
jgi:hypothetical protein